MTDPTLPAPEPHPAGETQADGESPIVRGPAVPGPGAASDPTGQAAADVSLLGLVDRLAGILDHSDLLELEIESGGTGLVLRKPAALPLEPHPASPVDPRQGAESAAGAVPAPVAVGAAATRSEAAVPARRSIAAPLTGLFYTAPTAGSAPYVHVGGEVAIGQVIGLIEAMKLFNEIKADIAGRVVRIVAENGALVKAKQPLLELDPL